MGDLDMTQLLKKLDFNGTHSEDLIAAAYFREAAIAIRLLERERDHYRHASTTERSTAYALRRQVANLERALAAFEPTPVNGPTQGTPHDS